MVFILAKPNPLRTQCLVRHHKMLYKAHTVWKSAEFLSNDFLRKENEQSVKLPYEQ